MALVDHWPLFELRITTPRLELRPPTDDDLDQLVELVRTGIHPSATMPFTVPWTDLPSPELEREALRYWWRCRAEFTPESWDLAMAVSLDGELVGMQNLTARQFPVLRTAETGSWLGVGHQGEGIGAEMRRAILHLAFDHLQARAVTSTAFADNLASQHVSLASGYQANGRAFALRRGKRSEQIRYLLTADRWETCRPDIAVAVEGFAACRGLFGLD